MHRDAPTDLPLSRLGWGLKGESVERSVMGEVSPLLREPHPNGRSRVPAPPTRAGRGFVGGNAAPPSLYPSRGGAGSGVRFQPSRLAALAKTFLADARHAQIAVLTALIALGLLVFDFHIAWWHAAAALGAAMAAQGIGARIVGARFDWRSPAITAASLTLLLRTDAVALSALAGALAIGSKFAIRWRGKHIFNPANFAIVVLALSLPGVWISPGQWGAAGWFALMLAGLGLMVSGKAKRWDVSLAYLASFAAIVFARALWYGEPMAIPLHQMQSGALLIFAFFMISDPMTTPNARPARLIHAAATAALGAFIVFDFYRADGIVLALIATAPLVPVLDRIFPASRYEWRASCDRSSNPSPPP